LVLLLNLIYGEVILRTPGDHQLTGYAKIYLGNWGKTLAALAIFISAYGALLAYLIKTGEFLNLIFNGFSAPFFSLLFFIFASSALFVGLRKISFFEGLLVIALLLLVLLIAFFGGGKIDFANFQTVNWQFLFLPYGVILFALFGLTVIPEMEEILREKHKSLKKSIIVGSLIPLFIYLLFTAIVVGVCGNLTSDDAISGLIYFFPSGIIGLGAVLGVLTMSSSYLVLAYVLREVWFRDFKFPKPLAFLLSSFPPLILFWLGAKGFIKILGITGSLMAGLTGVLVVLMYLKAKKKGRRQPAYSLRLPLLLIFILILILILGTFSPFFSKSF